MKRFICTASIFLSMVALMSALWLIRVPDLFGKFWFPSLKVEPIRLLLFLGIALIHFLIFVCGPTCLLIAMWILAGKICGALSAKFAKEQR